MASVGKFEEAVTPGFYTLVLGWCAAPLGHPVALWQGLAAIRGSCRAWRDWADDQLFARTISLDMPCREFRRLADIADPTDHGRWVERVCLPRELTKEVVTNLYRLAARWNDLALLTGLHRKAGLYGRVLDGLMGATSLCQTFHPQGLIAELARRGCIKALAWLVETVHIRRRVVRKMCRHRHWPASQAAIEWAATLS